MIPATFSLDRIDGSHAVDRVTGARIPQGAKKLHDLLIALIWVGMVITPAVFAAEPGSEVEND
jgi:hypothetical protein